MFGHSYLLLHASSMIEISVTNISKAFFVLQVDISDLFFTKVKIYGTSKVSVEPEKTTTCGIVNAGNTRPGLEN